jgi:DNA-binding LacI/PurR family transcriptional regulator
MQRSRPTLVDVARAAGVSRATASRVINQQPRVAPEVRQRVLEVVAELDYHPDTSARALASGRVDVLDLVVVEEDTKAFSHNPFYGRVLAGVLAALNGTDAQMRVRLVPERAAGRVLNEIADACSLGTLLVNVPPSLAQPFHDRCPLVVSLGRSAETVPFTEPENSKGARLAVEHLVATGRRLVAAIDGRRTNPCAIDRHVGYVDAVRAAGLRPVWADGNFCRQGGYAATMELLTAQPDLDGIFAACDLSATGALQALAHAGRRVPDDVAVVGFDGSVLATCANPPLTSVSQPVEDMTEYAVRQLLDRQVGDQWHEVFPVTLSVRASTAA